MRPTSRLAEPTGHVFRVDRKRGPQWYAKYRLPDGRQLQRRIGPAWTQRGRPAAGFVTKREAERWLAETLTDARRGVLPGLIRTGATFEDAVTEFMRYIENDRERKPSTIRGYWAIFATHQSLRLPFPPDPAADHAHEHREGVWSAAG